jgi:hypothetical protein
VDPDDITLDDLLDDEAGSAPAPQSLGQLLADGFPIGGGMAALEAIQGLADPDSRFAMLRSGYRQILERQRRERSPTPVKAPDQSA